MSDKLGWRPGYTHGLSEGKWTREESRKMKYERANPQHYDSPQTTAYAEGWERIFGAKKEPCLQMGSDGLVKEMMLARIRANPKTLCMLCGVFSETGTCPKCGNPVTKL